MDSRPTSNRFRSVALATAFGVAAVACAPNAAPVAYRTAQSGGYDSSVNPMFMGQPIVAQQYFELEAFDASTLALAYDPRGILNLNSVTFGDRTWQRDGANRFVLVGTDGSVSIEYGLDREYFELRGGEHYFHGTIEGLPDHRDIKCALAIVAAMSAAEPTEEVKLGLAPYAVAGILILLVGAVGIWMMQESEASCDRARQACEEQAIRQCGEGNVQSPNFKCDSGVDIGGGGTDGGLASAGFSTSCNPKCKPVTGGYPGASGPGGPPPGDAGNDAADSNDAADGQDSNDDSNNNDDNGGNSQDEDEEDTDGCEDSFSGGFNFGGTPDPGGISYSLSADDGGSGQGSDDC